MSFNLRLLPRADKERHARCPEIHPRWPSKALPLAFPSSACLPDGKFDTVLQNPPFGVQRPGADRRFLKKALMLGKTVYSLHKSLHDNEILAKKLKATGDGVIRVSPSRFLDTSIKCGGHMKEAYSLVMTIPYMFSFHQKKKHEFVVDLYIIESAKKAE